MQEGGGAWGRNLEIELLWLNFGRAKWNSGEEWLSEVVGS
jgi:hypothetical protein